MRLSFRPVATLAALLTAAACSQSSPTAPAVSLDVATARRQWQQAGLRNYVFTSTLGCFCDPAYSAAMQVTVRNGVVTAVEDAATGTPRPTSIRQPVDSIFAALERAAAVQPSSVIATYHPTYAYPVSAQVGTLADDSGWAISITSFRPLR